MVLRDVLEDSIEDRFGRGIALSSDITGHFKDAGIGIAESRRQVDLGIEVASPAVWNGEESAASNERAWVS